MADVLSLDVNAFPFLSYVIGVVGAVTITLEARAMIQLKRAYDEPATNDGTRVLVDRLWPRGLSKERAALDLWLKEVAPSAELRTWYGHAPERWEEFRRRHQEELRASPAREALARLRGLARAGTVTLITAARDSEHSDAAVLREVLSVKD
jgi:uncharacterized protein YeaO (DUF488 family)